MNNFNKNRKKKGIWSILLPYLICFGMVLLVVYFFSGSGSKDSNWGQSQLLNNVNVTIDELNDDKEPTIVFKEASATYPSSQSELYTLVGTCEVKNSDGEKTAYTFEIQFNLNAPNEKEIYIDVITGFETIENLTQKTIWKGAQPASESGNTFLTILINIIIPVGGVLLVVFIMFKMLGGVGGGAGGKAFDFGKSTAKEQKNLHVKFADVAGCDEEKAEMQELVEYLRHPAKFTDMGARIPKGVILKGPPGTGKTLLAKAVAGEAEVPFYFISGSDFVEMFVGVGASRVRDMFKTAKEHAPSMIFIDEIDAVGRQRGAGLGGGHDEREQTLNQLLVELDGFGSNSGVIVIAATNRPDVLDPALLRPGRFDRQITVNLPDKKGREAILKVHARNKKVSPTVDFAHVASRTPGFSGAELENVLNEAAILAVRLNKKEISTSDIDEAIDRVMGGPAKKGKVMSIKERNLVAYHESGHAIVGLVVETADVVQKVTIIPRGDAGGYVLMTPEDDHFLQTKGELLDKICGLLAGRVAEEVFFDDVTTGAHNDIEKATRIARLMVTELGMSELGPIQYEKNTGSVFLGRDYANNDKVYSSEIAVQIDKAVRKIIDEAYERARRVIIENRDKLQLVAQTLLIQETLTNEEIVSLYKTGYLPNQQPKEEIVEKEISDSNLDIENNQKNN